jgi:hypothetical protein
VAGRRSADGEWLEEILGGTHIATLPTGNGWVEDDIDRLLAREIVGETNRADR